MRILALEFSSRVRAVMAGETNGTTVLRSGVARESESRATPVFSLIERALREAGLERSAVQCVAVGLGPGSAMGIRAAIAVAQGWHLARGVTVVGLNSLDVLAAGLHAAGHRGRVDLACDAQRGEWHVGEYALESNGPRLCAPLRLVSREELLARIRSGRRVMGPDVAVVLPGTADVFPDATVLARLAAQSASEAPPENLAPLHLREPSFMKVPAFHSPAC